MADEVEREEVTEDDVEGQRLSHRIRNRADDEAGDTSAERLPRMSQDENDVEGQMFVRNRIS